MRDCNPACRPLSHLGVTPELQRGTMTKQRSPKLPYEFLWQELGYASAEEARVAGVNPAYRTYEWLHRQAEKASKSRLPLPWQDSSNG